MKTLYAACLSRLGLSQSEAATLHNTRLDTIKNWSVGRRSVPDGAWAELRAYEDKIVDKAEMIREAWEDAGEIRDVVLGTNGDPINLMAAADFLLSNREQPPVIVRIKD